VIEAVESWEHAFVSGVQWHPENMLTANDTASFAIFKGFITASIERK